MHPDLYCVRRHYDDDDDDDDHNHHHHAAALTTLENILIPFMPSKVEYTRNLTPLPQRSVNFTTLALAAQARNSRSCLYYSSNMADETSTRDGHTIGFVSRRRVIIHHRSQGCWPIKKIEYGARCEQKRMTEEEREKLG
jgi:hypothetical protein